MRKVNLFFKCEFAGIIVFCWYQFKAPVSFKSFHVIQAIVVNIIQLRFHVSGTALIPLDIFTQVSCLSVEFALHVCSKSFVIQVFFVSSSLVKFFPICNVENFVTHSAQSLEKIWFRGIVPLCSRKMNQIQIKRAVS